MLKGKIILAIDDDTEFLNFVKVVLEKEGFKVITAMDGHGGVKKAADEHPDLIILDVIMPELDGWNTCDQIRSQKGTSQIPIIFLTAVGSPKSLYQTHGAYETDWDEYITKPVKPKALLTAVKKVLQKHKKI